MTVMQSCAATIALAFALANAALAGNFQVSPVRLELSANATSAALTVRNEGSEAVVVQMTVLKWTQGDNADRYDATTEALVTPPIIRTKRCRLPARRLSSSTLGPIGLVAAGCPASPA